MSTPCSSWGTILSSLVAAEVQHAFEDPVVIKSLGRSLAAKARATHTAKVKGQNNCLGTPGGGVTVTVNGTTAGACVTGSPSQGITGGGASVGFSC
jgi:hypothetical protein